MPTGIGPGAVVHVEGLRVSIPASGIETLDVRISTVENRLATGSRTARVIGRVADAIVIDPSTDSVYTYNSGRVLIDHLGHFTFSEGFAAAFSPATEIIFQASALPRNTQLRFPATIESQTGARLTTADGSDVTLASGGSRNRVVYTFAPGNGPSHSAVDVFSFSPVLERTGPVGAGTGFYQVTIGPIGAAVPTRALPSTAEPRYDELLLPVLGPDLPASKTFLFPVEQGVDTQTFTISNTATGAAPLTIRAFDEAGDLLDGSDVTNERSRTLGARQTLTFDLGTMFGPGATAGTVASVAIESKNEQPVATKIGTAAGGAYAVHSQAPVEPAYFPFDRRSAGEMPLVSVAGAGAADFESRWMLMDTAGVEQAAAVREAGAGGAVRGSLERPVRHHGGGGAAGRLRPGGIDRGPIPGKPRGQSGRRDSCRAGAGGHAEQPVRVPLLRHRRGVQHRRHAHQRLGADSGRDGDRIRCRWGENRTGVHDPDLAARPWRNWTGRRFSEPAACAKGISRWMSCRPIDRTRSSACRIWRGWSASRRRAAVRRRR